MAVSWINIDQTGTMSVNARAATTVLEPLGDADPVNLVAIFGAARQGKSFLMNCLMGRESCFRISNARVPMPLSTKNFAEDCDRYKQCCKTGLWEKYWRL